MRTIAAIEPLPPEVQAYALARYSRSADTFEESLNWVRSKGNSDKFLDEYYFQYGHASIADLGHITLTLEGVSELAAIEIEDEVLWDGQAKSSRYQDFSKGEYIIPDNLDAGMRAKYCQVADNLLKTYALVNTAVKDHLFKRHPKPASMKDESYDRALSARAFDYARYCLFLGIPTNIGQVTSIRTLERQIRRLLASPHPEVVSIAQDMIVAASKQVPTLAKYLKADTYEPKLNDFFRSFQTPKSSCPFTALSIGDVTLYSARNPPLDTVATLMFTYGTSRQNYANLCVGVSSEADDLLEQVLALRGQHDELPRAFRSAPLVFEITTDIGAYRDLHRHRRCIQFSQRNASPRYAETPQLIEDAGVGEVYRDALHTAVEMAGYIPHITPFGARKTYLFKMDLAEADYISRLRSGVKGHFSYRKIAWAMKELLTADQDLSQFGRSIQATPPWIEDPLTR